MTELTVANRRFLWGLSQGIVVLGCAGSFWVTFGVFGGVPSQLRPPWVVATGAGVLGAVLIAIVRAGRRLRQQAGFSLTELRTSTEREDARRQVRWFVLIALAQFSLDVVAVVFAVRSGREDLIWPLIGLALGAHFIPLAWVFRVPTYGLTGIGILAVSLASLAFEPPLRILILGFGTGLLLWATAVYLAIRAERMGSLASGA